LLKTTVFSGFSIVFVNILCPVQLLLDVKPLSSLIKPIHFLEMQKFIEHTRTKIRSRSGFLRSISIRLLVAITASSLIAWPTPSRSDDLSNIAFALSSEHALQGFESRAAMLWGHIAASHTDSQVPVRYEAVLGAEQVVGSHEQRGTLAVVSVFAGDPRCGFLLSTICKEPRRLFPGSSDAPNDVAVRSQEKPQDIHQAAAMLSLREEFRVYLVRRGDSLWNIAKRFSMNYRMLARINGLRSGAVLQIGRPLKVKVSSSQELKLNLSSQELANHPALLDYIRMIDGHPVPHWLVTDYVADIIDKRPAELESESLDGDLKARTVVIQFQLVKNILEGRARLYQPMVMTHAEKYDLDPALIMAMIHTESAFNPNARSNASAYGLMQLVPQTAGQEAYHRIYGQQRTLTPEYLFDPNNNIELGTAYLHILSSRYLGAIADPLSRTYCVVAAYHAGPSSVGRVFTTGSSIQQAASIINGLKPAEVYKHLVEALPSVESRNYLRDVIKRVSRYSGRYSGESSAHASNHSGRASI
jgi:soluble lytic murein transglycosylase-like protein